MEQTNLDGTDAPGVVASMDEGRLGVTLDEADDAPSEDEVGGRGRMGGGDDIASVVGVRVEGAVETVAWVSKVVRRSFTVAFQSSPSFKTIS